MVLRVSFGCARRHAGTTNLTQPYMYSRRCAAASAISTGATRLKFSSIAGCCRILRTVLLLVLIKYRHLILLDACWRAAPSLRKRPRPLQTAASLAPIWEAVAAPHWADRSSTLTARVFPCSGAAVCCCAAPPVLLSASDTNIVIVITRESHGIICNRHM